FILVLSNAIYLTITGKALDAVSPLICALGFLLLYVFLQTFTRRFTSPFPFILALVLVVLVYITVTVYVVMITWMAAFILVPLSVLLLLTAIEALAAIKMGGLRVFKAVNAYKRRWGRNGPYTKFVISRSLTRPIGLLYFGGAVASLSLIPITQKYLT